MRCSINTCRNFKRRLQRPIEFHSSFKLFWYFLLLKEMAVVFTSFDFTLDFLVTFSVMEISFLSYFVNFSNSFLLFALLMILGASALSEAFVLSSTGQ